MEKTVLISLTSIQWQDDEKNESELFTRARYSTKSGCDVISYDDSSATGFEGSVTTITVDGSRYASIVRSGAANSVLTLETGRKHFCQYDTPFGGMQIGVYTHTIKNTLSEDGKLYLKYTLDLNSSYLSDNEIIMKINH